MPLYEYCCAVCGASEERLCGYGAPGECDCPSCGAPGGMRRQVSAPAITFAGGGWYAEGYSHAKSDAKSDAKAKADKPGKADGPACAGGGEAAPQSACCEGCPAKK